MRKTVGGRSVRYATGGRDHSGDEPAAVLVHGAGGDRTVWQMQTRWIAHHGYRVAALDLPGHGGSEGPALGTIEEMGDWLASAATELALAPAHLVGHSMGTFVVLEAAARHPETVRSIVLLGTAGAMPVHPALQAAADADDPLAGRLITSWGVGRRAHVGGHASPGMWLIGGTTALLDRSPPGVLGNDLAACGKYRGATSAARRVRCPVTLVLGAEDRMTPNRAAQKMIAAFGPGLATTVYLERVGHFMQTESPVVTRKAIAEALAAAPHHPADRG